MLHSYAPPFLNPRRPSMAPCCEGNGWFVGGWPVDEEGAYPMLFAASAEGASLTCKVGPEVSAGETNHIGSDCCGGGVIGVIRAIWPMWPDGMGIGIWLWRVQVLSWLTWDKLFRVLDWPETRSSECWPNCCGQSHAHAGFDPQSSASNSAMHWFQSWAVPDTFCIPRVCLMKEATLLMDGGHMWVWGHSGHPACETWHWRLY